MKQNSFDPFLREPPPIPTAAGPFEALPTLIAHSALVRPDHLAVITGSDVLNYQQLDDFADRVAASFQRDIGTHAGARIAICAANSNAYIYVWIGALRAGLTVVPLPTSATSQQLRAMIVDSGATHLFADAAVRSALTLNESEIRLVSLETANTENGIQDWLVPPGAQPTPVAIEPEWAFNIIYSSGTTGTPKGIVQPHQFRWELICRSAIGEYGPDSITLVATPLCSNTTLTSVLPTLARGGCLILMPKFDAEGYLALAQMHGATHTMLVPVQYQRLLALPSFDEYDLRSFRYKFCTSAPFHPDIKADVLARWPGGLIEYYGMTEGGGSTVLFAHLNRDKLHTVGKPALGHDIRMIDEKGSEVAEGDVGEIVGRSPMMMIGYNGLPDKTAETEWYDSTGRRFIRHGDVGRFDEDGFVVLVDRQKDMIISGGFNIYPSDLEAELRVHPGVADAAVIGVPSVTWGETPFAFVVQRSDANLVAADVCAEVNATLGKTQRLSGVAFTDELPRSQMGKVLKTELRQLYEQTIARSAS